MLTDNHIREAMSAAYINAVTSRAGFGCSIRTHDYGIDGSINDIQIRSTNGRRFETGFGIDFQAKASENCVVSAAGVTYDLEVKAHHDLVEPNRGRSLILVVLALPKDPSTWLTTSGQQLALKRCAWWTHLRGDVPSSNEKTVRIKLPTSNVFDVPSVQAMMDRVRAGGLP